MSEVKVNKISPRSGTGVQLGDSGDTITIPAGATINNQGTATNFGATGSASWTTTVKTSTFTAVAGEGYFVNTTGGVVSVNLPAGVAGAVVAIKDYAGTFDTNAVTLVQNGSDKIGGSTGNKELNTEGIAVTLIFIDSTQGWLVTDDGLQSNVKAPIVDVQYLVVAGGGAGGAYYGGGGGAGGLLTSTLSGLVKGVTLTATVGAGGASVIINSGNGVKGNNGVNSSLAGSGFTTVTAAGGGGAGANNTLAGNSGGSGGGGSPPGSGGSGTVGQGNNGGTAVSAAPDYGAAGGGGAGAVGGSADNTAGSGGVGVSNSITGSAVFYAGGGGGSSEETASGGAGGNGGGGASGDGGGQAATPGTDNTGGGGGGANQAQASGAGGKGVVILSVPDASYSGTVTGSPTVATGVNGKTVITFTGTGTYVI